MPRKWFLVVFLFLSVPLLLNGCGVAQEQYNAVVGERDTVKKEVQSTRGELETSRNKVSELTSNLTKAQDDLAVTIKERDDKQVKNLVLETSLNGTMADLTKARKDISRFESDVAALKARIPVLEYETYTNNETGFSINYPKKWNILINLFRDKEGLITFADMNTGANIIVTVEKLPKVMTAKEYLDAVAQELSQGYVRWGSKEITVNRIKAEKGTFTELDVGVAQVIVALVNGNSAYTIVLTHNVNEFFDYAHTFNEVVNSFKISGTGI
jgi:hypothetical protein